MIENLGGALWYKMNPVALGKATEDSDLFVTGAPLKFIAFWHTHPVILHNPSTMDLDNMIVGRTYFIYCIPEDRLTIWEKKGDY
jgi:proteasome lid subunit RPN8/RPN11